MISGNANSMGVRIHVTGATGNIVLGNFIGTNASGTAALANFKGVFIDDVPSNTIGGTTAGARNIISGNTKSGVVIEGASASGNLVQGNFIGTDVNGTADVGNSLIGVLIVGAPSNTIGGTTSGARNVISGNDSSGVEISESVSTGNLVRGNFIGTDVNGTADLGNSSNGVLVRFGATNNTIGGTTSGARNIISGNDASGVELRDTSTTSNLVQGNFIGTDLNGTADLGNAAVGVVMNDSPGNTIGGTTGTTSGGACTGACNLISGNNAPGVLIVGPGSTGNLLEGNFIGTDVNGTDDLGNSFVGVGVQGGATNNTIGGTATGAGNLISGNDTHGVAIVGSDSTSNKVHGNSIGAKTGGTSALGNANHGVFLGNPTDLGQTTDLGSSSNNFVGGTASGAGNTIAFNGEDGVYVGSGTAQAVLGNSIFSNTGLGIDIGADGVTSNDSGDADTGANNLQNTPELSTVVINSGGALLVNFRVQSTTGNSGYPLRIEFFEVDSANEEGKTFLTSVSYLAGRAQLFGLVHIGIGAAASLGISSGDRIVATATDANNNTSEFSADQVVTTTTADLPGVTRWGLIAMAVLMGVVFVWALRRRAVRRTG